MQKQIVYLTSIYGEKYLPFLLVFLKTLEQHREPESSVVVLWNHLPDHEIKYLVEAFPKVRFNRVQIELTGEPKKDVPLKIQLWRRGIEMFPEAQVRLLDCDTLFLKNIGDLVGGTYDILYTYKDEKFKLNTGVMIVNNSVKTIEFFRLWLERIEDTVRDKRKLLKSIEQSGAVDQHVLFQWLGNSIGDLEKEIRVENISLLFKGVPCSQLNETRSCDITDEASVVHYKGGWQPILLENQPFNEYRPQDISQYMYDCWMDCFVKAARQSMKDVVVGLCKQKKNRLLSFDFDFQPRGILHSEMLIVCALCESFNVDVIIESGRFLGQSTYLLAKYFENSAVVIESIERNRDKNAEFCERRLQGFHGRVNLLYGDCLNLLPKLLKKHAGEKTAVLLDGPKGQMALNLFKESLKYRQGKNVVLGFFHDTRKDAPYRDLFESSFKRVFFSDDPEYVEIFRDLDKNCILQTKAEISPHSWQPYMKGNQRIESYGPTLCAVMPLPVERLGRKSLSYQAFLVYQKMRSTAGAIKRKVLSLLLS